jgi:hypothetical protein
MMLSKAPSKNRSTIRLAKFEAAPWHIRMIDQQKIVAARYLPMGNLTKPKEPGILAKRYPK